MVVARATRCVASLPIALFRLVLKRFASFFHSRPFQLFAPVVVGMCLGVAVNMTLVPYGRDSCETCVASQDPQDFVRVIPRSADPDSTETVQTGRLENEKDSAEGQQAGKGGRRDAGKSPAMIRPRVVPRKQTLAQSKQRVKPILRPVFAATELGIREKLLVGVLMSSLDSLATRGAALNWTLAPHASKTVFFLQEPVPKGAAPPGMTVVELTPPKSGGGEGGGESGVGQEATRVLRHLGQNWPDIYDFYLLLTDAAMIRGARMLAFLETTSVGQALQLGAPSRTHRGTAYCPLEGGLVISQLVLSRVLGELDHCDAHFRSADTSLNLAQCLRHAANSTCSDYTQYAWERRYSYYELQDFNFDRDIEVLKEDKAFNNSISIFPVHDDVTHYKLHQYFCELDLEESVRETERVKQEILATRKYLPEDEPQFSWPLGVGEPSKPRGPLDQFRWDYFTQEHIYFKDDFSNVDPLIGADRLDARERVEEAVSRLRQTYGEELHFTSLRNGYRRFDPRRGMDYILDLVLTDAQGTELEKRVHLVKPLSKVDVVPMPPTSEKQMLTLVLPVTYEDDAGLAQFLDQYGHVCLDPGETSQLLVVFVHTSLEGTNHTFGVSKALLAHYTRKYADKGKISWTEIRTNASYIPGLLVPDALSPELKAGDLVVMATTGMILAVEFLNRIRMNVIRGRQVFFPIGFWEYKPNLIYETKPYPPQIAIEAKTGHYDPLDREHSAFFLSDFLAARAGLGQEPPPADLLSLFLQQGRLHVLRAVDPGLKHRFRQLSCPPSLPEDVRERCLERRAKGLASRGQLADLMFQYQKSQEKKRKTSPAR